MADFVGKPEAVSAGYVAARARYAKRAVENAVQSLAARQAPNELAMSRASSASSSEAITQRPLLPRSRPPGRRLDFWTRVRAECSTLPAMRSGLRWDVTGRNG
jgi:hypothetical protein